MSFVEPDDVDNSCFALFDRTSNDTYFTHYTNHSLIEQDRETHQATTTNLEEQTNAILNDDEFRLLLNPNIDHSLLLSTAARNCPEFTDMPSPKSSHHIRKISRNDSSLHEEDEVKSQFSLEDEDEEEENQMLPHHEQFSSSESPSKSLPPFIGETAHDLSSNTRNTSSSNEEYEFYDIPSSASRAKPLSIIRRPLGRKYNKDKISASLPVLPTAPTQSFESKAPEDECPSVKNLPLTNVDDSELTDNDVLCGRGGGTNSYIGNRNYRAIVQSYQPEYLKARRKDKPLMARDLVKVIREKGGRFLKRDSTTRKWNDIGDEKAESKTGQALREGLDVRATNAAAASLMSRSTKSKVSPSQTYTASPERRTIMISGLPDAQFSPLSFSPQVGPSLPRVKRTRFEMDDVFAEARANMTEDSVEISPFQPPKPLMKKIKYAYDHVVTKPAPPRLQEEDEDEDSSIAPSQNIFRSKSEDTTLTPGQFEYWAPSRSWSRDSTERNHTEWAV
jgi:hypothetical protein